MHKVELIVKKKTLPATVADRERIQYQYEAYKDGKLLTRRIDSCGDYTIALVVKGHKHPYMYSMPHLFKSEENFEKRKKWLKVKPFAIAIKKDESVIAN